MGLITQQLAKQRDNDLTRVSRKGEAASRILVQRTREAVIRAYAQGSDPVGEIKPRLCLIVPVIRDAMVTAHLQSHYRSLVAARRAMVREKKSETARQLSVYDETIAFLKERTKFTAKQLDFLRTEYEGAALAATEDTTREIEATVQRALLKVQKQGLTLKDASVELEKTLSRVGLPSTRNQIETMIRTQAAIAQSVGQQRANEDPEIAEMLWGYEYFAVGDDRTRPNHQALDGVKLPKDDPRWSRIMPPNGFNCRCRVVEIFEKVRIKSPPKSGVPDTGWDVNPADVFGRGPIGPAPAAVPARPRRPAPATAAR